MGIDKVSVHDVPEAGTVIAAMGESSVELVLAPQDAGRNVAFLVSGIYGTGMWQIMDLERLVEGCEITVEVKLNGNLLQRQTFVGKPIEVTNLPEGVEPAADFDAPRVVDPISAGSATSEVLPPPIPSSVAPPPPLD